MGHSAILLRNRIAAEIKWLDEAREHKTKIAQLPNA